MSGKIIPTIWGEEREISRNWGTTPISGFFMLGLGTGFPSGSVVKNPPANAGDKRWRFFPGSGRSPGEGNGNPLQYSCLGNPMDRGVWQSIVHWVAKSQK